MKFGSETDIPGSVNRAVDGAINAVRWSSTSLIKHLNILPPEYDAVRRIAFMVASVASRFWSAAASEAGNIVAACHGAFGSDFASRVQADLSAYLEKSKPMPRIKILFRLRQAGDVVAGIAQSHKLGPIR